jgi:hypothetical protein
MRQNHSSVSRRSPTDGLPIGVGMPSSIVYVTGRGNR